MLKSYFSVFFNSIKDSLPLMIFFLIFPWKEEEVYRVLKNQFIGMRHEVIAMIIISMAVYFFKKSIRKDVYFHLSAVAIIFFFMIFELFIYNMIPAIGHALEIFREKSAYISIIISVTSLMYFLYKSIMQRDDPHLVGANCSYSMLLISFILQMAFLELVISRFFFQAIFNEHERYQYIYEQYAIISARYMDFATGLVLICPWFIFIARMSVNAFQGIRKGLI